MISHFDFYYIIFKHYHLTLKLFFMVNLPISFLLIDLNELEICYKKLLNFFFMHNWWLALIFELFAKNFNNTKSLLIYVYMYACNTFNRFS